MNKVILLGRLTKDPEIRYTQNGSSICRYTLAVNRSYRRDGDQQTADFIQITAFGARGEFAKKFFHKGLQIVVVGELRTSNYEKEGVRHYSMDVIVSEQYFAEKRNADSPSSGDFGGDFAPADGGNFYGGYQENNQRNGGYNGNYQGGYQNQGSQNYGYQNQSSQNFGYQNSGYQAPNYQNSGYQNPGSMNQAQGFAPSQNESAPSDFAPSTNKAPAQGAEASPEGFTPVDSITEDQDLPF